MPDRKGPYCRWCYRDIESFRVPRCPYCNQPFCSAFVRDCEAAHIDKAHPNAAAVRRRELDAAFPAEETK